ncbi:hypothetical protein [Marispirochaeta aestuarii]|uniref:hypothetical protein n=1 Tax=Marispirochaeta aestuarii TaxID=1963862 RepID=UPI0029C72900|nr:hypothetical protein [Marispirochaeta aestuarii]
MKKRREGITSQKIDDESAAIFRDSTSSTRIQIRAGREVSGSDAVRAPKKELRLAISETRTTISAEMSTFSR